MKAGRELDALIAEKVMGLKKTIRLKGETNTMEVYTDNPYFSDGQCSKDELLRYAMPLHYSTAIADVWLVVEKMRERGKHMLLLVAHDSTRYHCNFFEGALDERNGIAMADTAHLVICLAALKAVGVEVEA